MSLAIAEKCREMAKSMRGRIFELARPRPENTPKRQREAMARSVEARHLERTQDFLLTVTAVAEQGVHLDAMFAPYLKSKAAALGLMKTRTGSSGYYNVHDTGEFMDQTPSAVAVRQWYERQRDPQSQEREARRAQEEKIKELERKVKFANISGFFPTPAKLADEMVKMLDLKPRMTVLEPSAGKGDLAEAVRRDVNGDLVDLKCIEQNWTLHEILTEKGFNAYRGNFLELNPFEWPKFDRIIMNPPYERLADIDHVRHAFKFLKPSGWISALVSASFRFRSDRKAVEFREWLESLGCCPQDLGTPFDGDEAFRQAGVRVHLLYIEAPGVLTTDSPPIPTPVQLPVPEPEAASQESYQDILDVLDELRNARESFVLKKHVDVGRLAQLSNRNG